MAEVKKRDLTMVPIENLEVEEGFNIRPIDPKYVQWLVENIRENGQKEPLQGYKKKNEDIYVIKDGHHRYEALKILQAEVNEIIYAPFVLESQKYSAEQRIIDMFILNSGKPLTPLEKAEGVRRLINFGYSPADIARKIGCSPAQVSILELLLTAPKKLADLIRKEVVSASLAVEILRKGEADKFLQDVEAGNYAFPSTNGQESGFGDLAVSPKKITKKDVAPVNSFREFKKWTKNVDHNTMDEDKAKMFKWLCRMMNNELTEEHFKRFFR